MIGKIPEDDQRQQEGQQAMSPDTSAAERSVSFAGKSSTMDL